LYSWPSGTMSGICSIAVILTGAAAGRRSTLVKPFRISELVSKLTGFLGEIEWDTFPD